MIKVKWYDEIFTAEKAACFGNKIVFYDDDNSETASIFNISDSDWPHITLLEGEWTPTQFISDKYDILRADVDFLLMLMENSDEELL